MIRGTFNVGIETVHITCNHCGVIVNFLNITRLGITSDNILMHCPRCDGNSRMTPDEFNDLIHKPYLEFIKNAQKQQEDEREQIYRPSSPSRTPSPDSPQTLERKLANLSSIRWQHNMLKHAADLLRTPLNPPVAEPSTPEKKQKLKEAIDVEGLKLDFDI